MLNGNLNLNLLRIFHAAAEQSSFTRAAAMLHLTQPGISKHIKALEEYFGTPLFDRLGRKLSLTQAGRDLYESTLRIFQLIEEAKRKIDDLEGNAGGQLRIGASITLGIYVLLPYVKQFRTRFPDADIAVDISLSEEVEKNVLNNIYDLGFIGSPAHDGRLIMNRLFDDELILVLPPDHRWCARKTIRPEDLNHEPFLISQPGSGTRGALEERFGQLGIAPRLVELGHTESIKRAVEAGLGISILSHAVVERELKLGWLKTVKLQNMNMERSFYYIYRKGKYLSKTARSFLALMTKTSP